MGHWRGGNHLQLLENGETFFPRVFDAIGRARREVLVETFIVGNDEVGRDLQAVLAAAARRGVRTVLTMDGYGSAPLRPACIRSLVRAGVRVDIFDPRRPMFGWRTNIFRRLHRKLVVVDGERAFVGGMNFTSTHLSQGREAVQQDYAVEVVGPVVQDIHRLATRSGPTVPLRPSPRRWRRGGAAPARVLFAVRDNENHHNDIELQYRLAIRKAQHRIIIANAYFLPGYRLIRDLYAAAGRGVEVHLIMQGNPDKPAVRWATATLYDDLRRAGISIHEFRGPLHAKVACIDDDWSTIGSSNLDPLSLFLNLEANLVVSDRAFTRHLESQLSRLIKRSCDTIAPAPRRPSLWRQALATLAFHALRRYPQWAGWAPGRRDSTPQPALAHARARR